MDMPDGWQRIPLFPDGWRKGGYRVYHPIGAEGYVWTDTTLGALNGGFLDPVSCAVACELDNGGCTDGHA